MTDSLRGAHRPRSRQLAIPSELHDTICSPRPNSRGRGASATASPSIPCTPLQRLDVNKDMASPRSAKRKHAGSSASRDPSVDCEQAAKKEKEEDGTAKPKASPAPVASSSSSSSSRDASVSRTASRSTARSTSRSASSSSASSSSSTSTAAAASSTSTSLAERKRTASRSTSVSDFHGPRERTNSVTRRMKGMYRSVSQRARQRVARHKQTPSRHYFGEPERCRADFAPWASGVSEAERKDVPRREQARREAIHELCHREQSFLAHISETLNVYAGPMLKFKAISEAQQQLIFFRLTEIRDLHQELYVQLNSAIDENGVGDVGNIVAEWIPKVTDVYSDYLSNQAKAKGLLETLRKESRVFLEFVETGRDLSHLHRMDLSSLLDLPRHKLTSYQLLLGRILKYTPAESEEHAALDNAIRTCVSVVQGVDMRIKLAALQSLLDSKHKLDKNATVLFERKAHFKDDKEAAVYVLPTMVIVTKMKKGKEALHGKNLDMTGGRSKGISRSGSFRLSRRGSVFSRSSFVIKFRVPEDKHAFITTVHTTQEAAPRPPSSSSSARASMRRK
ncbi:hypothetical protein PTSG_06440 [Salpingoeca rosetta]|uniref:DH domain-containing protein n=1 Tax=Salpingoeca rosetta (strain ATCC 50818 / BSB-021) TaxID=946362 RepID=F2UFT5_SALR5|nr:uncharacterized protein PTSG_06440 [Salpingoeca rosetta]EGD75363.1 hypothetical protein PTSG_06440 [Salpingoeca rosetta]|eukprot:XP_004991820.1 hypothetical protein PTSG_06440 [Salpingoeca rosetta]